MLDAGYRPGMSRDELWQHHWRLMSSPMWHLQSAVHRLRTNLLEGPPARRALAWGFLGLTLGVATASGVLLPVALGWLLPLFVVGQMASWTEAVSRHRWLVSTDDPKRRHAELSHGRFLGVMPPPQGSGLRAWAGFWLHTGMALLGRALAVPGDLPHHAHHHLGLDRPVVTGMVSWVDSARAQSPMLWIAPHSDYVSYASLSDATDAWFVGLEREAGTDEALTNLRPDEQEDRLRKLEL